MLWEPAFTAKLGTLLAVRYASSMGSPDGPLIGAPLNFPSPGPSRWDQALDNGPNTNGQNAYITLLDGLFWTTVASPMVDPTAAPPGASGFTSPDFGEQVAKTATIASGDGATFVSVGSAVFTGTGAAPDNGLQNRIHVRVVAGRRVSVAGTQSATESIREEIWSLESNTWAIEEVLESSIRSTTNRFFGVGTSLFFQVLNDAANELTVQCTIDRRIINGYTA